MNRHQLRVIESAKGPGKPETRQRIAMLKRLNPMEISQFFEDAVRYDQKPLGGQRPDAAMAAAHEARLMIGGAWFTADELQASRTWLVTRNYEVPGEQG